jgi:hypothetical protein
MKKLILAATIMSGLSLSAIAQKQTVPVTVYKVVTAEKDFNRLVERKGMKAGFLSVADVEGIVFRPNPVKITEFYGAIDKQSGKLSWEPKFARVSANGDLGFTSGPYVYQNGKSEDDKVFGQYVSLWKLDAETNTYKLLLDVGMQHPESETAMATDFKEPDLSKQTAPSKDPFSGKNVILATDKTFNHSLDINTLAGYKEFLSPEGHYYFPGFEPTVGPDKVLKFLANEGVSISAETINAGRATSGDLAYSYGKARIKKGNIVNNYNYVRVWELDANHRWNILLEILSTVE